MDKFINRKEAGIILAEYLKDYKLSKNTIILALPRGGVPVAYEVAQALSLPLDIFIVRKLGAPEYEELAMGAIASAGTVIFNKELLKQLDIEQSSMDAIIQKEQKELIRREDLYRGKRDFPHLKNKTIIVIDDGIATGATMKAAVVSLRKHRPASIVIAVPVAAQETCAEISKIVDQVICPLQPIDLNAVGIWYENFPQVSDKEVIELLEKPGPIVKK